MITVSMLLELPENVYEQMRSYIEKHPEIDVDRFVTEAISCRLAEADTGAPKPGSVERSRWPSFLIR